MEQIRLAAPISKPATTAFQVVRLTLDWESKVIDVTVRSDTGETQTHTFSDAESLLRGLNTANLSTTSLHRRILGKMVADGLLAGSISGVPE